MEIDLITSKDDLLVIGILKVMGGIFGFEIR